jgi:hypothetical protein
VLEPDVDAGQARQGQASLTRHMVSSSRRRRASNHWLVAVIHRSGRRECLALAARGGGVALAAAWRWRGVEAAPMAWP